MKIKANTRKPNFKNYKKHECWYDNAIIWNEYGYWQKPRKGYNPTPPEWLTKEYIKKAYTFAKSVKEPDICLWYKTKKNPIGAWGGIWVIYDKANKVIYWENAVTGCKSEQRAEQYIRNNFHDYSGLYGGVINALLVYKNTGFACLPDWNTNKIDTLGYKDGEVSCIPRAYEVLGWLKHIDELNNA